MDGNEMRAKFRHSPRGEILLTGDEHEPDLPS